MASSLVSNRSRTCCRVSDELVHPISGSTALGEACSKSSTHDLLLAVPDCIAVLAGVYMRAGVINGGLFDILRRFALHTGTRLAVKKVPGGDAPAASSTLACGGALGDPCGRSPVGGRMPLIGLVKRAAPDPGSHPPNQVSR